MNGVVAKIFGLVLSVISILSIGAILYITFNLDPRALGFAYGSEWILGIFLTLIYVLIVGYLTVLVHTRELAERQVELLEEIRFQLTNQPVSTTYKTLEQGKTEPRL